MSNEVGASEVGAVKTEVEALGLDFAKYMRVLNAGIAVYRSAEGKELIAALTALLVKDVAPDGGGVV